MTDQLFVELVRNGVVESRHFGSAVVCDCSGRVLHGWGNFKRLIFPRSSLKPFQAISLGSSDRASAIQRIQQALIREPLYAAGHGTVVSELNQVTHGRVLAKTGAEGVLTAALPEQGLGIALKISDGNARARATALLAILDHLSALTDAEKQQLHAQSAPEIENSRGRTVGEIRAAQSWLSG